jgi:hypothetical protein
VTAAATTTRFAWNLAAGRTATDLSATTTFVGNQRSVALATTLTTLKSSTAASPAPVSASGKHDDGVSRIGLSVAVVAVLLAGVGGLMLLRRRRARDREA